MEVNPVWDVQTTILTKEYNLAIACMLFWHSVLYQYDTPFAIAYCMYFGGYISEGHDLQKRQFSIPSFETWERAVY